MKELTNIVDLKGQDIFVNLPEHNLTMVRVKVMGFLGPFIQIEIYGSGHKRRCFIKLDEIKYFEVN